MLTRVLVIDDDVQARSVLASTLLRLGFDVSVAGNGREGMKLFDAEPADLVITAIFMPDKEGIETIIDLKQCRTPPKVIAVSGPGAVCKMDVLGLARQVGADAVMAKPVSLSALIAESRRLLDAQAAERDGGRRAGPERRDVAA